MAEKNTAEYTVTIDIDTLLGLSIAERKNSIEQAFTKAKEKAIDDLAKKLH